MIIGVSRIGVVVPLPVILPEADWADFVPIEPFESPVAATRANTADWWIGKAVVVPGTVAGGGVEAGPDHEISAETSSSMFGANLP